MPIRLAAGSTCSTYRGWGSPLPLAASVSIVDLGADLLVTIDGADSIRLLGVKGVGANTIDDFRQGL